MKIEIIHKRVPIGNDITVKVNAENKERISSVQTKLDRFSIGNDRLNPPNVSYDQVFPKQGSASPGRRHTVTVKVRDKEGNDHVATHKWTDIG